MRTATADEVQLDSSAAEETLEAFSDITLELEAIWDETAESSVDEVAIVLIPSPISQIIVLMFRFSVMLDLQTSLFHLSLGYRLQASHQ